jgi:succinate dehydrogenase / fumarate reductase, cytochrome b subunit
MSWIANFYRSAIGKKAVMAVTGIMLFGFILIHMIGNLKLYTGTEPINAYAGWLRSVGYPAFSEGTLLNVARGGLLLAVFFHILAAVQLTMMNRRARPIAYTDRDYPAATYAARTMRWSGFIVVFFVLYHLAHFTWGTVHPDFRDGQVYHNVVVGFSNIWVSLFYIIANILLGLHLYHGLWSLFQSLGWNHPRFNSWRRNFATTFAVIVTVGNVSFPIAVLTGVVQQARQEQHEQQMIEGERPAAESLARVTH